MVLKNKFSTALAIILITGVFFVLSQSRYAYGCDPCDPPPPDPDLPEICADLNLGIYVGEKEMDDYEYCLHHSHVLINPCCDGCIETLSCLGIDFTQKKWKEVKTVNVNITRPHFGGAYTLYFVGDLETEFFYTNDFVVKALLKDKFIPRIDGFRIKPVKE